MIPSRTLFPTTAELWAIVSKYRYHHHETTPGIRELSASPSDEHLLDILEDPFRSIDDTATRLGQAERHLRNLQDRRSVFLTVYTTMTANVQSGIQSGFFTDPDWVREYVITFAEYYRRAAVAFERRDFESVPRSWQLAFAASITGERLVALSELESVELTRLDTRYEGVIELTKLVLARRFFDDITSGDLATYSLFINMNSIYEAVVERAFREAATRVDSSYVVEGQGGLSDLIDGQHAVDMTPDVVVKDATGDVLLVGDAKWKTGSESSSDIYQLTSYMLADTVPGVIVHPSQSGAEHESQVLATEPSLSLSTIHFPTAADVSSYEAYTSQLVDRAEKYIRDSIY